VKIAGGTACDVVYGRVAAAVVAAGAVPRRRTADLMIAASAIAEGLPLFTTNPDDYAGPEKLVRVIPVTPAAREEAVTSAVGRLPVQTAVGRLPVQNGRPAAFPFKEVG
jgi:hypothetical protein